ncbi:MAG: MFS transporter [Chloroflexi bacterium]|nr:MAG: MFS transporter [Chloroflexota bacterium]
MTAGSPTGSRREPLITLGRLVPIAATVAGVIAILIVNGAPADRIYAAVAGLALLVLGIVVVGVRELRAATAALPPVEETGEWHRPVTGWAHTTFGALEDPNFRPLFLGNIAQFSSMQMQLVVRGWLVFHLTGSFAALGTMALANAVPSLLVSPIGGVVADRANKKMVIQVAQGYNAINAAILAVLAVGWFGLQLEFWHLFLSAFLQGCVNSIMQPSRQAMISDLVPRERLMNAIGINSSGQTFMQLVGPGIAGFVIAARGPAIVFFMIAFMYVMAMVFTMNLPRHPLYSFVRGQRPGGRGGHGRAGGWTDLVEGAKYIARDRRIGLALLVNFLIVTVSLPYTQLLPGFVAAVLDKGALEQGILQSIQGFGALAGAVFVASAASKGRGRLFLGSGALLGAAIVLFSISTVYVLTLPIMIVLGFAQACRMALGQVLIQEYSEEEYRGRVASVMFMEFGLVQFGTFAVGVLASLVGPQLAIGGLAAVLLFTMALTALLSPTMRNLE